MHERRAHAPDTVRAITVPVLAILASLLVSATAFAVFAGLGDDASRTIAFVAGSGTLAALGVFLVNRLPAHRRRMAIRGRRRHVAPGAGIGLLLAVAAGAIVAGGAALDPGARERLDDLAFELPGSPVLVVATAIAVVVLAPIGEELVFRALLLRELVGRMRTPTAVIVSAMAFTAAHADAWLIWPRALALFALGVGFALVYRRYGLPAAIASHAAVNLAAVVLLLLQGG